LKVMASLPTRRVNSPSNTSIRALPVLRKDLPRIKEVELKDLPPHLEYAFLEGDDKLPVIIAKDLSVDEKTAFITVLKSHKRAIAWKLFDIKVPQTSYCLEAL
nr:reverse transcriptase domain-containing protein [Tanacetum cinerariifolium]